ncbi:unnamed protein product [Rotaria magnacalcarata]|uniref:DUF4371 domain-containing protein n=1 Tax=Rotaria magnacalcarata TaxID=392030 RepID=A0A8S2XMN3_9BILA|nr:unnamed protein product [Rotaria magnacalcarata]
MSSEVREKISSMLNNHNYALMTDECRDLSGTQQLSIVIRFVHDQYIDVIDYSNVVKEYFLGFVPLEEFDAATLTLKIVEFINKLNIPLRSCICLCFDILKSSYCFFSQDSTLDYVCGEYLVVSII